MTVKPYAGIMDMIARFGEDEVLQLSDRYGGGNIDVPTVELALQDATAEIDAYLGRFKQPFGEVPPILRRLCCDIARYRLCAVGNILITDEIRNRYQIDVLNLLKALGKGEVHLGLPDGEKQAETSDLGVVFTGGSARKVFGR